MTKGPALVGAAALEVGLAAEPIELIRSGSNEIYRLPDGIVARLGPANSSTAIHELAVAKWLAAAGIDTVEPLPDVAQPTATPDNRWITWWRELPPHRPATPAELGGVLAALHHLDPPAVPALPALDPFDRISHRIHASPVLTDQDRNWLLAHLDDLQRQWRNLPASGTGSPGVVHGDAWQGNLAATNDGRLVLLDLEHVAIGLAEWDLTAIAVDQTDFARIDTATYHQFVTAYGGYDTTTWPGYRTLADIWELRWTTFALHQANQDKQPAAEWQHRLRCIQGKISRPWTWSAI